ncbi:MAG TPA: hypothetical protein VIL93_01410 [Solirubrobacterales bacterium]
MARKLTDPLAFAATVVVVIAAFLGLDAGASAYEQLAIGVATWALLLAASAPLSAEERSRVALVVLVATGAEVMGSIVLGAYTYRLENLPAFVPPGHGLVYLAGLRISRSAPVLRHARTFVAAAAAVVVVWVTIGLVILERTDLLGALAGAGLVYMLLRGRAPTLYAGVFVIVAFLELYGTSIGAWHWAQTIPGTPVGAGNPPSGIASIYVLFDIAAITLAPRLLAALDSLRRLPPLRARRLILNTSG